MNRNGVLDISQMVDGRLILREAAITYLGIELADLQDAGPPPIPRSRLVGMLTQSRSNVIQIFRHYPSLRGLVAWNTCATQELLGLA
jgi:hypothetical protein